MGAILLPLKCRTGVPLKVIVCNNRLNLFIVFMLQVCYIDNNKSCEKCVSLRGR